MASRRTWAACGVGGALLLSACSGGTDDEPGGGATTHVHTGATSLGQPDEPIAGPQGNQPQFLVECAFSHAAQDDPIVFPDQPGMSHLHVFFGNTDVDAGTTAVDLIGGTTTCDQQLDTAAYWAPALFDGDEMLEPVKSTAYYRPGIDVDPASVQAYPVGLMMIAGNSAATDVQPVSIVAWSCGAGIEREVLPPECAEGRNLRLVVTYPDCWDGSHLDSADHHAHVAYSARGKCPDGFPVAIPQLQFSVEYPFTGDPAGLKLASGGLLTGHADFINGWDQDKLQTEVELCLHRGVVCGVSSGKKSG